MSEKITMLCPIYAVPGKGAAMKAALAELAAASEAEGGNICYIPHETDNPDEFIIYEQWRDAAALESHMETAHLQIFLADEAGLLAAEPHGQVIREIR